MSPDVKPTGPRDCPIADALGLVGDRWSLLVLREVGLGNSRFNDIAALTGAPRDRLSARLRDLEGNGLLRRRKYQDRPARYEYLLTDASRALLPVLDTLRAWGEVYARDTPAPVTVRHSCGEPFHPRLHCAACGEPATLASMVASTERTTA